MLKIRLMLQMNKYKYFVEKNNWIDNCSLNTIQKEAFSYFDQDDKRQHRIIVVWAINGNIWSVSSKEKTSLIN